eukprot:TRINITY_DN2966_c0_g1_i1.p1 TRINITY_DN2966_c0_g1~~TRINITY_DN2966_c0_g1_i1.p1  ORF type:complete len:868 (-),score=125.46 TRINITY_DN2966_c0_g1_i1:142-2745(-)
MTRATVLVIITVLVFMVAEMVVNGKTVYVSPTGSSDGTKRETPTSIVNAFAFLNISATCGDTVILTQGEYYDVLIPSIYCSTNDGPITIIGEQAVMSPKPIQFNTTWVWTYLNQTSGVYFYSIDLTNYESINSDYAYLYNQSTPDDGMLLLNNNNLFSASLLYGMKYVSPFLYIGIPFKPVVNNTFILPTRSTSTFDVQFKSIITNITFSGCNLCLSALQANVSIINNRFYNYILGVNTDNHDIIVDGNHFEIRGTKRVIKDHGLAKLAVSLTSSYFSIVAYGSVNGVKKNLIVRNNVFYQCFGLHHAYVVNCTINNNKFIDMLTDVTFVEASSNLKFTNNLVLNPINSIYTSNSGNNFTQISNNIVYSDSNNTYFPANILTFTGSSSFDQYFTLSNNIIWTCQTLQPCYIYNNNANNRGVKGFRLEKNILLIKHNSSYSSTFHTYTTNYTYNKNIVFSPDSQAILQTSSYFKYFCANGSSYGPCFASFTQFTDVFRSSLNRNFGIDSCLVDRLEDQNQSTTFNIYDLSSLFHVGNGLNSLNNWFGNVDYVGPFPSSFNPGRNWPLDVGYDIFKYNTILNNSCNCSGYERIFIDNPSNNDILPCDTNKSTCPFCGYVSNETRTLYNVGPLDALVLDKSNVSISGNVSFNSNSQFVILQSMILIEGSLAFNETSTTTITFNSLISITDEVTFNGILIIDFSKVDAATFDEVLRSSKHTLTKYTTSSTSTFSTIKFIPPSYTTGSITTGSMSNSYDFIVRYDSDSLNIYFSSIFSPSNTPSDIPSSNTPSSNTPSSNTPSSNTPSSNTPSNSPSVPPSSDQPTSPPSFTPPSLQSPSSPPITNNGNNNIDQFILTLVLYISVPLLCILV